MKEKVVFLITTKVSKFRNEEADFQKRGFKGFLVSKI